MLRVAEGANNLFRCLFYASLTFLFIFIAFYAFFKISFFIFLSKNTPIISESVLEFTPTKVDLTCNLGTNLLPDSCFYNLDVDRLNFLLYSFYL